MLLTIEHDVKLVVDDNVDIDLFKKDIAGFCVDGEC